MPEIIPNNKIKLWILLGVIVVVLIIIIVAANSGKTKTGNTATSGATPNGLVAPSASQIKTTPPPTPASEIGTTTKEIELTAPVRVDVTEAGVEISGTSLATPDTKGATPEELVAKDDLIPVSTETPKAAININVKDSKFSPATFSVQAGEPVLFTVTAADGLPHVIVFGQTELRAVALGIGPNETKSITFNAPERAGEYEFRCDISGHRVQGEIGKMIVK